MPWLQTVLEFFVQYWLFLALVTGTLVTILIVSTILNAKSRVRENESVPLPEPKPAPIEVVDAEVMNPDPVFSRSELEAAVPAPSPLPDSNPPPPQPAVISPTIPEVPRVEPPILETIPAPVVTEPAPKPKKPLGKYHVMYRSEDKKWYVKREGSTTIMRVLETQREAISWAIIKALPQDIGIVVHEKDGKIKKAQPL